MTVSSHNAQKINFRWITDFNVQGRAIRLPEEGIGDYLHGLAVSKGQKSDKKCNSKGKIDSSDYIKIKNCSSKDTVKRVKS